MNTAALAAEMSVMLRPLGWPVRTILRWATNGVEYHRGRFRLAYRAQRLADFPRAWGEPLAGAKSYLRPCCSPESEYCCPTSSQQEKGKLTKSETHFALWPVGRAEKRKAVEPSERVLLAFNRVVQEHDDTIRPAANIVASDGVNDDTNLVSRGGSKGFCITAGTKLLWQGIG